MIEHLFVYHSVHIIGAIGILLVLEVNYSMKKDVDKRKRFGYIRFNSALAHNKKESK